MTNKEKTIEYIEHRAPREKDWLLTEAHWQALEQGGWIVEKTIENLGGDWLAKKAYKKGLSCQEAVIDWSNLTGLDPDGDHTEEGGYPHDFRERAILNKTEANK